MSTCRVVWPRTVPPFSAALKGFYTLLAPAHNWMLGSRLGTAKNKRRRVDVLIGMAAARGAAPADSLVYSIG